MNIQNTALVEAAARIAAEQAGSEQQAVSAFIRALYKNFSPHGDFALTADQLAAAALPLWRAAAGAASGATAGGESYRKRLGAALAKTSADGAAALLARYG